ncbi:AcrR family transcriptional regulator [Thermocatellispora tengchongensis]|uniref:AcrR family transcriptional regulator n=1 Tax=Thermocatellispora tengchongensis TaxID=1073253 RepID=A0A840NYA8_9ACTN|nr:TetR/AcrR family transcriptional regulator [Thermocatellispora tengchongensis]MBB5132478.1 AcrR family transcriptional regulator [Thermocatellispora tengchongensis]
MPRSPSFTHDQILDAARDAAFEHWRSATVGHVTALLGAPSGSIYHRFASRDVLFGSAWIRSIRAFQAGLTPAAETGDPIEAIVRTALWIPEFCRRHPRDARMMTVFRYADLVATGPPQLQEELRHLNDPVLDHLRRLTERRYGRITPHGLEVVTLACHDSPYGIVRPIIGERIPAWIDDAVRVTSTALAHLDDTAHP